jgi:hypothetical protein
MSNTTKQLLPEQIGCIDRDTIKSALESTKEIVSYYEEGELLKDSEYYKYKGMLTILSTIQSQLFPIVPILEDAFGFGFGCGFNDSDFEERKQRNLTQPITIKL